MADFNSWNTNNIIYMCIPPGTIKEDIIDFSLCIKLGASNQDSYDSRKVFDALSAGGNSYINRKKIAITTLNGKSQVECPIEIDIWDDSSRSAVLWAKIPKVYANSYTFVSLYYDVTAPDNTAYVDDTSLGVSKQAWDDKFVGVWHFSQAAGTNLLDSTGLNSSSTWYGGTSSVDGSIGKSLRFNAEGDYVSLGDSSILDLTSAITVEALVNVTSGQQLINKGTKFNIKALPDLIIELNNNSYSLNSNVNLFNSSWNYIVWAFDHNYNGINTLIQANKLYRVGFLDSTLDSSSSPFSVSSPSNSIIGDICELRVSNTFRSVEYLMVQEKNLKDALLKVLKYRVYGTTTLLGKPVQSEVSLYERSSGNMISVSTSNSLDGTYILPALTPTPHYVIGLGDQLHNSIIRSKLIPKLI